MSLINWLSRSLTKNKMDESTLELVEDLDEKGKILLDEFLDLAKENADDVMVPRPSICAIPVDINENDLKEFISKNAFSRYPIYKESLDDIIGFVHIRDIAFALMTQKQFDLTPWINQILFVPESISVLNLMQEFSESRIHIAVVVDEFGSTHGLVTASDILRHLLGETLEESEEKSGTIEPTWVSDRTVIVGGQYEMEDLIEETHITFTPDEQEQDPGTLNGYVQLLAGRVPDRAEVITNHQGIEFHILDANPRSVIKVKITWPKDNLKK